MRGRQEEKSKSLCLTRVNLKAEGNGWNEHRTPQVRRKPPSPTHNEEEDWNRRDNVPFALLPQMVCSVQGNPASGISPFVQNLLCPSTVLQIYSKYVCCAWLTPGVNWAAQMTFVLQFLFE